MPTNTKAERTNGHENSAGSKAQKVRYAVIGLGWIAQEAVLPAFRHTKNSTVVALDSAGHNLMGEKPDEVLDALVEFLRA